MDFALIQEKAQELGRRGGIPPQYIHLFDRSPQNGKAHIEIDGSVYRYVVEERGARFIERATSEIDELLFWILDDATAKYAFDCELEQRCSNEDPRRVAFPLRIQLMRRIRDDWGERTAKYVERTLQNAPFVDG